MMDLAELTELYDPEGDFEIAITHPQTGEPTGIIVKLAGFMSPRARLAQRILEQRTKKLREAGVNFSALQGDQFLELDSAGIDAALSAEASAMMVIKETIAARVTGWSGITLYGEDFFPFSHENVKRIFGDPKFDWLAFQLFARRDA